jgi:diguanylate cyclase
MDASIGLVIQCVGILLVTLLSFFIMRSIQTRALRYWTLAWSALSLSLVSLVFAFHLAKLAPIFYSLYFLGEYVFGFMFVAGCRQHATDAHLTRKQLLWLLPLALIATLLPHALPNFNDQFMVHAFIIACFFSAAFWSLRPARRRDPNSPGMRVMSVALVLLAINFFHYIPVFGLRYDVWGWFMPTEYLKYTSIFDLILEILLGFGTVMVLMEGVRRAVEATNLELTAARDRLETLARVDPLTQAFNRHAFHSLLNHEQVGTSADAAGCVVVIDIDNLKPINDSHGHAAGDEAIRAVARAVRSLIRADDMLFRWGGDEFLLLLFGLAEAEARKRMELLNAPLAETRLQRVAAPVSISVSYGIADFNKLTELQQAIEHADSAMYQRKQSCKAQRQHKLV